MRATSMAQRAARRIWRESFSLPYMIEECAGGRVATEHPDRLGIGRQLGEIAARIHEIPTSGFGQTFDWSQNTLSRCETWRDYLEGQLDWEARVAALTRAGVLPSDRAKRLQAAFRRVLQLEPTPALNHGDLRLKNLLVDDDGKVIAVIDWEDCQSNVPRIWEFALALHDMGIDEKGAFLKGYGLTFVRRNFVHPCDNVSRGLSQTTRAGHWGVGGSGEECRRPPANCAGR